MRNELLEGGWIFLFNSYQMVTQIQRLCIHNDVFCFSLYDMLTTGTRNNSWGEGGNKINFFRCIILIIESTNKWHETHCSRTYHLAPSYNIFPVPPIFRRGGTQTKILHAQTSTNNWYQFYFCSLYGQRCVFLTPPIFNMEKEVAQTKITRVQTKHKPLTLFSTPTLAWAGLAPPQIRPRFFEIGERGCAQTKWLRAQT